MPRATIEGAGHGQVSKYVGIDVYQETVAVAVAQAGGEVRYVGEIANTLEAVKKLVTSETGLGFHFSTKPDQVAICGIGNCTT